MLKKVLGIIGGGQLGLMLTEAAKNMGEISKVIVLDPTENCPATQAGAEQIVGDFKDEKAITKLAEMSDLITYEIESGDSKVLKSIQGSAEVNPSPETLKIIQDKYLQKEFLNDNNIPVASFVKIDSKKELNDAVNKFGLPAILKLRRDAYDGRGNFKINSSDKIDEAWEYFKNKETYLEKFVDFKMEVSVVAARNTIGEIATYPLVENIHEENILRITVAPARVSQKVQEKADSIAKKTMEVLKGAGVFGIEMFVTKSDEIMINEIAPRVHNSGHHTLVSSVTSQFEQHLRAILGLPLGSTKIVKPTVMYNILGPKTFTGKYKPIELDFKNAYLKMYGKKVSKPLRKLGHVNLVSTDSETVNDIMEKIEKIKQKVQVVQA